MKRSVGVLIMVLVAVVLSGAGGVGYASPSASITYVESNPSADLWLYQFTFTNTSSEAGFDLFQVRLDYSSHLVATSLLVEAHPSIWDAQMGLGFVDFSSLISGTSPTGSDIGSGQALTGFCLGFEYQLGSLAFTATFVDPSPGGAPITVSGNTTPVPEPASLLLLSSGLLGLAPLRKRAQKYLLAA